MADGFPYWAAWIKIEIHAENNITISKPCRVFCFQPDGKGSEPVLSPAVVRLT
jgi:hypothetical protein